MTFVLQHWGTLSKSISGYEEHSELFASLLSGLGHKAIGYIPQSYNWNYRYSFNITAVCSRDFSLSTSMLLTPKWRKAKLMTGNNLHLPTHMLQRLKLTQSSWDGGLTKLGKTKLNGNYSAQTNFLTRNICTQFVL